MDIEINYDNVDPSVIEDDKLEYYKQFVLPQALKSIREKIKCKKIKFILYPLKKITGFNKKQIKI